MDCCKAFNNTQRLGQIWSLEVNAVSSKTVGFIRIQSRHSFTVKKKKYNIKITYVFQTYNIHNIENKSYLLEGKAKYSTIRFFIV